MCDFVNNRNSIGTYVGGQMACLASEAEAAVGVL